MFGKEIFYALPKPASFVRLMRTDAQRNFNSASAAYEN